MTDRQLGRGFWITFALGLAWSLYRALTNQTWILDDELSHYLISKDVWSNPSELWHPWSRPGRNLLQFLPAYFGLDAARLWTLGLSAVAVWLTAREGKRLGMKSLWMLPLLIWFQWWFPELSYPVLTQAPFLVVWIAAVFFAVRARYILAAISWGYLGLVRHEGIALTAMWGLWVIFAEGGFARYLLQRRFVEARAAFPQAVVLGLWTILPMVVMNVASGFMRGEWPFLMFFESKPTDYYGSGPLWLYCRHLLIGAGLPVALLMLVGAFWKGWKLHWDLVLYGTYPAYLAMHSLIYWKGLFASGGYYHFIMPMAPWVGLLALRGMNQLSKAWTPRLVWLVMPLVVWGGLAMPQQQFIVSDGHIPGMPEVKKGWKVICPSMGETRLSRGLKEAASWLEKNVGDRQWITHHVVASYYLDGKGVGEQLGAWSGYDCGNLAGGTVLLWDAQYSVDTHGFTEELLEKYGWAEQERFAHGTVRIYLKRESVTCLSNSEKKRSIASGK